MTRAQPNQSFGLILRLAAFAVFAGRAWQHLRWDAPFRSLLWDERLLRPWVEKILGISWQTYVTSPATEQWISNLISGLGWVYLAAALAVWTLPVWPRISRIVIVFAGINLILLALLYYKEHFYFLGQFFEYTLQWSSPFFLLAFFHQKKTDDRLVRLMKIAIALTFTCHGLYAVGFYPRPGYFMQMTMSILGLDNAGATTFLRVAGILDFAVSLLIFLPGRFSILPLAYAVAWGFATTIARVWAHFYPEMWTNVLDQWLHESVMRFPHFLIPLFVLLYVWSKLSLPEGLFRRPGSPPSSAGPH